MNTKKRTMSLRNRLIRTLQASPAFMKLVTMLLLFEDLHTLMAGGESVIGDVMEERFGAGASDGFAHQLRDKVSQAISESTRR